MNISRQRAIRCLCLAAGTVALFSGIPSASADVIVKTLNWNQGDDANGTFNSQAMGVRFTVTVPTHITSIEGTFGVQSDYTNGTLHYPVGVDGNIWGAIINIASGGLPSMDFSSPTGAGIVASKVFNLPIIPNPNAFYRSIPVDVTTPLSADLLPGTYGLVFAEGGAFNPPLPDAHHTILMSENGTVGTGNYTGFYYQGGWANDQFSAVNRVNFGVQGTTGIPEPTSATLGLAAGIVLLSRRRSR